MTQNFDVVIVGGGIIGSTLACEVRKAGLSIAVLEKGRMGEEASKAAAGILAPHAGPKRRTPFLQLLVESLADYPRFIREVEDATGQRTNFLRSGLLYLALNEEEEAELEQKYGRQIASGINAEWLTSEQLIKLEPAVGNSSRAAIYFPEDCQVDNVKLMEALREWAHRLGVRLFEGEEVIKIKIENETATGVITKRMKLQSSVVVLATGAWSGLDYGLPFKIPVKPSRGQIVTFRSGALLLKHMIHIPGVYVVQRNQSEILVGSTVESAGFQKDVTAKGMLRLTRGLIRINPEFGPLTFNQAWSGLRPRSRDSQPILGPTPIKGLILATGHFRSGLILAPITARLVSTIILGGNLPFDISPFEISRFFSPRPSRCEM